jgi:uncharacterized membrane protein YphA (DoxX/SURF4 family)
MEDGTPGEALLLLAWPLAILGIITAGVLFIFPRTRKFACAMLVVILLALCAATLAGKISGQKRIRVMETTEQAESTVPVKAAPSASSTVR